MWLMATGKQRKEAVKVIAGVDQVSMARWMGRTFLPICASISAKYGRTSGAVNALEFKAAAAAAAFDARSSFE